MALTVSVVGRRIPRRIHLADLGSMTFRFAWGSLRISSGSSEPASNVTFSTWSNIIVVENANLFVNVKATVSY